MKQKDQYGEPFEGEELAMPRAFDLTDEDAEVILEALEKLKGGHNNENHPHHDNRHQ